MSENNIKITKISTDQCIQSYYMINLNKEKNNFTIQSWYFNFLKSIQDDEYIIFEKVFGCLAYQYIMDEIHKDYLSYSKKMMHPMVFIEGNPIDDSMFSGAVIYTVKYTDDSCSQVRYLIDDGVPYATEYQINNIRKLYLTNSNRRKALKDELNNTTKGSFEIVKNCLDSINMPYRGIIRTWFYLNDINQNYFDFNRIRRNFFDVLQIDYSQKSNQLPASTCIGGNSSITDCVMEFYCVDKTSDIKVERIFNKDQNEAEGKNYLYQSTFSRAIKVSYKDYDELQISGTASINSLGETIYDNDPYNQIKRTFLNIKNLLDVTGMGFSDISISTCFFKEASYFKYFDVILEELEVTEFPTIHVIADVCREDLLFEMDAVAVKIKN